MTTWLIIVEFGLISLLLSLRRTRKNREGMRGQLRNVEAMFPLDPMPDFTPAVELYP